MTLYGVFKELIRMKSFKELIRMKSLWRGLIQYDWCPCKKRLGQRGTEGRLCEDTEDSHLQATGKGLPNFSLLIYSAI